LEQENTDPPTAERAAKMAEILRENADEWIALAVRVPDDLEGIIQKEPIGMSALLREANGLTAEQPQKLGEQAKKMKGGKTCPHLDKTLILLITLLMRA
jgi:HTH-type transcriptional regulator, competence development regulator